MYKNRKREINKSIPLHHLQDLDRVSLGLKKRFLDLVDLHTPMKLIKHYFTDDDGNKTFQWDCPHGHSFIGRASFCPKCGQAFERSN